MATLGVSDDDWRYLGNKAFEHGDVDVAKKAYVRIKDVMLLSLLEEVGERVRRGERGRSCVAADVLALQGLSVCLCFVFLLFLFVFVFV